MSLSLSSSSSTMHRHDPTKSKAEQFREAKKMYLKLYLGGWLMAIITVFAVFSIYWGALWKIPTKNLPGWVVDFDGGEVGQAVLQALQAHNPASRVDWTIIPASEFSSPADVGEHIVDEKAWVAVTINPGASARLTASLASPNASYNGAEAVSAYGVEGRNENVYRNFIRPTVQGTFDALGTAFAAKIAQQAATSSSNITALLTTSPQTIVAPLRYELFNLRPFNQPVASAVTFVGLLYQLILSLFVVMAGMTAREMSGLERMLSTKCLIKLRYASSFTAYFVVSLFYCLLSSAFQLDVTTKFGRGGFMVFWMLNYVSMLSVGLALDALVTLLTIRFIPFFMITWVIVNVSVCTFPLEIMPSIYRYGHAAPFYNVSRSVRTIIFGTKNHVGESFGILFVWIAISCITMPLIQIYVRRRDARAAQLAEAHELSHEHSQQSTVQEVVVPVGEKDAGKAA